MIGFGREQCGLTLVGEFGAVILNTRPGIWLFVQGMQWMLRVEVEVICGARESCECHVEALRSRYTL